MSPVGKVLHECRRDLGCCLIGLINKKRKRKEKKNGSHFQATRQLNQGDISLVQNLILCTIESSTVTLVGFSLERHLLDFPVIYKTQL
jgi:hypothetical protein